VVRAVDKTATSVQAPSVGSGENKSLSLAVDKEHPLAAAIRQFALAKRGQVRGKKGGKKARRVPNLPPDLAKGGREVLSIRLRFNVSSTVSQVNIDDYMIQGTVGGICSATNNVTAWATAIRLKRLTIWPGAGGEATIIWATTKGLLFGAPDIIHDETLPSGITFDKPVTSVPPKGSPAAMWHVPTTGTPFILMNLTATSGGVIDMEVDFTLGAGYSPTTFTVTSATAGNIYYLPLDGVSTHKLTALGRPTTF